MQIDESKIRRAVLSELAELGEGKYIPVGISARHVHLSEADIAVLFGEGYSLHPMRALSQPGQFAAHEQVAVIGPRGRLEQVRVLGPARRQAQVEISVSDAFTLGIRDCPVRLSGDLAGSAKVTIKGPQGEIKLDEGLIIAARHVHMNEHDARVYGVHDRQVVAVRVSGDRPCVLENVVCRTGNAHELEIHLDTDEANACGLSNGDLVELVLPGSCDMETKKGENGNMSCNENFEKDGFSMSVEAPILDAGSRNFDAAGIPDNVKGEGYRQSIPAEWREPTPAQRNECKTVSQARQAPENLEEVLDLVTERNIHDAIRDNKPQVFCDCKALITPAARECAAESGIRIVRMKGRV